jgi:GR25 family glycosyltransferase involved in LPS biosynthesis
MRIGITFCPEKSVWYSGANQTALLLAELFDSLKHDVMFVDRTRSETEWCSDYPKPDREIACLYKTTGLDWLIDVDGLVRPEDRKKAATKSIVFLRTFLQFTEMDATVYSEYPYTPRSFQGVHEIWCWDILNPANTIPSIQTLFPCPIRRIPFIWSPSIVNHFSKKHATYDKDKLWTIRVSEKNQNSNISSSVLPLVAIREMTQVNHIQATYHIHNMDAIKENKFLKTNVLDNIEWETLPITFSPKEPWYNWVEQSTNSAVISHSRFTWLRPSLLHLLWFGIPLVHNSPILSELHPQLRAMYYKGNEISEMASAVDSFLKNPDTWYDAQKEIRDAIIARFSIESNLSQWRTVWNDVLSTPIEEPNQNTSEKKKKKKKKKKSKKSKGVKETEKEEDEKDEKEEEEEEEEDEKEDEKEDLDESKKTEMIIAFSDMWPGFNYDSNFITDALRHEDPSLSIKGMKYVSDVIPALVIFGPFSSEWKQIPRFIPKVYFSGENWDAIEDKSIALSITSSMKEDDKHIRIPTWMSFIDWYTKSTELPHGCTDNPIRLPLSLATKSHPIPFSKRSKFCAFVVSNPICALRNEAFQKVNEYKPVSSGGALYNNIGGQLELKYAGGGCGDLSKYAFFSEHQFTISFENSQSPGYLTEKLLHAKMAGCVPLYWGDSTSDDFVPNSFINLSSMTSADQIVDIIKKLEARPDICETIAATPILDDQRKRKALRMISAMSKKLLSLIKSSNKYVPLHLDRIDNTFMVNLDSRPDRLQSLLESEPRLKDIMTRIPAVHGKTLQMNSTIYKLCKNNPFQWKKSVIGCYLSHLTIWTRILQEPGNLFLVLEDDVRFQPGWVEQWNKAAASMPEDTELIYWGGVLPPNMPALPLASESVSEHWSRIKPNTLFSSKPSSYFHFCTYSYLITKAGAKKLIKYIQSLDGMPFPGCDHLLIQANLQTYLTNPLLAKCFQDDDPVYMNTQFDKVQEKDNFDSDIRNEKDCFTVHDLIPFLDKPAESPAPEQAPEQAPEPKPVQDPTSENTLTMYYISDKKDESYQLYEGVWIEDILQCRIKCVSLINTDLSTIPVGSWFIVQRPHIEIWNRFFHELHNNGNAFKILHLSDEFCKDDISFYSLSSCHAIIRNYFREDVPKLPHILTIPLGYHHKYKAPQKPMNDRKWLWSFHGTDWLDRSTQLYDFQSFVPHSCHLQPDWNHSSGTKQVDYLSILGNSKFCPILKGHNSETFRFYEALEAGVLPVFGKTITPEYISWVKENIDLSSLYDWTAKESVEQSNEINEHALQHMIKQWSDWKEKIKAACQTLLSL